MTQTQDWAMCTVRVAVLGRAHSAQVMGGHCASLRAVVRWAPGDLARLAWSRNRSPCLASGLVATPSLGRDPLEARPSRDINSNVTTPFQPTVRLPVATPKPCRYRPNCHPCRETKKGVVTPILVAQPPPCRDTKAMSRHPLGCPFHDMKNDVSTKDQLGPSPSHVATLEWMS